MKTAILALALIALKGLSAATLAPAAMEVLPLGAVKPAGWLAEQCRLQADGLTGHAEEIYPDIGLSDWLTGLKRGGEYAWERGPYYAKGLLALAFVTGSDTLKAKAENWVRAILSSQRDDGDFGPKRRNWWANMPALTLLRDWADATGDSARVEGFMRRYFDFQRAAFAAGHGLAADSRWAVARGGDEMEAVLWLYGKTGDASLLDFAAELSRQTTDWARYYAHGGNPGEGGRANGYSSHIVNIMQGLKTPALRWLMKGSAAERMAYRAAFAPDGWMMRAHGRPDMMLNGTEPLSGNSASEGTELCATAERIASAQTLIAAFGDAEIADDLETVAYNTLPATLAPDIRGVRYYCLMNQAKCADEELGFANVGAKCGSICPGPHAGFGCCRSNFHMAWPKFVQTMWMARGGGLAAVAYGDCTVDTPLSRISERGGYPFADAVTLTVERTAGGEWPLWLRLPGWCATWSVEVNGMHADVAPEGGYLRLMREWKAGDMVRLSLNAETRLSFWAADAVSVRRGPLVYALRIDAEERVVARYRNAAEGTEFLEPEGFPRKDLLPKSPWGYALVLSGDGTLKDAAISGEGLGRELRAKAIQTDFGGWGYMRRIMSGRAIDPPPSPVPREGAEEVTISLVPFGLTQLRIAIMPWTR